MRRGVVCAGAGGARRSRPPPLRTPRRAALEYAGAGSAEALTLGHLSVASGGDEHPWPWSAGEAALPLLDRHADLGLLGLVRTEVSPLVPAGKEEAAAEELREMGVYGGKTEVAFAL